jgi:hypothetical protein
MVTHYTLLHVASRTVPLTDPELEQWRLRMLQEKTAIAPYPVGKFNGRGIVLSAGGRYFPACCFSIDLAWFTSFLIAVCTTRRRT